MANLLAFGTKLQAFVTEVRELAAGENDAAALQKLRRWPAERVELHRLREFEVCAHSKLSLITRYDSHGVLHTWGNKLRSNDAYPFPPFPAVVAQPPARR